VACYTPSNDYGNAYQLRDTIIIVVSACVTPDQLERYQTLAETLFRKFRLSELGVRELAFCGGSTNEEAESSFQTLIRSRFFPNGLV